MSALPTPDLERKLEELTEWSGQLPRALWQCALTASNRHERRLRWARIGLRVGAVGAVAAVLLFIVAFNLPHLSRAREFSAVRSAESRYSNDNSGFAISDTQRRGDTLRDKIVLGEPVETDANIEGWKVGSEGEEHSPLAALGYVGQPGESLVASSPPIERTTGGEVAARYVVRKATIELDVQDVRAAFSKAALLVSEASGEFVQESSLTGEGSQAQGTLTLRVSADRLSEVLNRLRELGKVRSEAVGGEDVTTKVVDLDSRMRNERRVEAELLELLEKRKDAPLADLLQLRNALNSVRESIEQLTGQRERLGRLVELATVLVLVRGQDAPLPAQTGLGAYLRRSIGKAWDASARAIVDSLALLLNVLVGGAVWWVLLAATALVLRTYWKRRASVSAV